jgi:curved DNA-binding protein CbpA
MPSRPPSHYERLGVTPEATPQQLRQAFRSLSKRVHPDTTTLPPPEAEEAFRQLQHSYRVLVDPESRAAYDRLLHQAETAPIVVPPPTRTTASPAPWAAPPGAASAEPRPVSVHRSLSGGEWFALLLLAVAMALSLLLGLWLAWSRGVELVRQPSWWPEHPPLAAQAPADAAASQPVPVLP